MDYNRPPHQHASSQQQNPQALRRLSSAVSPHSHPTQLSPKSSAQIPAFQLPNPGAATYSRQDVYNLYQNAPVVGPIGPTPGPSSTTAGANSSATIAPSRPALRPILPAPAPAPASRRSRTPSHSSTSSPSLNFSQNLVWQPTTTTSSQRHHSQSSSLGSSPTMGAIGGTFSSMRIGSLSHITTPPQPAPLSSFTTSTFVPPPPPLPPQHLPQHLPLPPPALASSASSTSFNFNFNNIRPSAFHSHSSSSAVGLGLNTDPVFGSFSTRNIAPLPVDRKRSHDEAMRPPLVSVGPVASTSSSSSSTPSSAADACRHLKRNSVTLPPIKELLNNSHHRSHSYSNTRPRGYSSPVPGPYHMPPQVPMSAVLSSDMASSSHSTRPIHQPPSSSSYRHGVSSSDRSTSQESIATTTTGSSASSSASLSTTNYQRSVSFGPTYKNTPPRATTSPSPSLTPSSTYQHHPKSSIPTSQQVHQGTPLSMLTASTSPPKSNATTTTTTTSRSASTSGPSSSASSSTSGSTSTFAPIAPMPNFRSYPNASVNSDTANANTHPNNVSPLIPGAAARPLGPVYGYGGVTSGVDSRPVKPKRKRATTYQLARLNETFNQTCFPSSEQRLNLALELGMTPRTVQIWFQNKRQGWRTESSRSRDENPRKAKLRDGEGVLDFSIPGGQPIMKPYSDCRSPKPSRSHHQIISKPDEDDDEEEDRDLTASESDSDLDGPIPHKS